MPSGYKNARYAYKTFSAASQDVVTQAQQRTQTAEDERSVLTGLLGSPDQVAGTGQFSSDPRIGNYTSRYTLSPFADTVGKGKKGPDLAAMNQTMSTANGLLQQAEEAARAGDFSLAEQLRGQATEGINRGSGVTPGIQQEFFNLERNPNQGGIATLSSPIARIVGGDVARAGEIRDPNSASYRELYSSLTDAGLAEMEGGYTKGARAITQGYADSRREASDMAAGRGAGRNALGEQNLMARVHEAANTNLANMRLDTDIAKGKLLSDATRFLVSYGDEFRRNTVQYATDWVNGAPHVRDAYISAQNSMAAFSANIFEGYAAQEAAFAAAGQAKSDARAAYYRNLAIAVATVVVTAGIGAIAGAAGVAGLVSAGEGALAGAKIGATIVGGEQVVISTKEPQ